MSINGVYQFYEPWKNIQAKTSLQHEANHTDIFAFPFGKGDRRHYFLFSFRFVRTKLVVLIPAAHQKHTRRRSVSSKLYTSFCLQQKAAYRRNMDCFVCGNVYSRRVFAQFSPPCVACQNVPSCDGRCAKPHLATSPNFHAPSGIREKSDVTVSSCTRTQPIVAGASYSCDGLAKGLQKSSLKV